MGVPVQLDELLTAVKAEGTWEGGAPVTLEPRHPRGVLVCEVCIDEWQAEQTT